jgi:ketosteroid isomerase-like protein
VNGPSVQDRLLIDELYARYSWALDTGDTDGYVDLFTPDAVVYETVPDGLRRVAGREEIREFVLRFHRNPDFPGRQHRFGQLLIARDPAGRDDRRLVRSYVLTTETKDGYAPTLYWCGWCEDVVRRLDGRWLIESRTIRPWTAELFRSGIACARH